MAIRQRPAWQQEARDTLRITGPAMLSRIVGVVSTTALVVVAGHIGRDQLAAFAAAQTAMYALLYVGFGLSYGLDTLSSQAHGALNSALVRDSLSTALGVILVLTVPLGAVAVLWGGPLMVALGQTAAVGELTSEFLRWHAATFVPLVAEWVLRRWLLAQGITRGLVASQAAGAVVSVLGVVLMVTVRGLKSPHAWTDLLVVSVGMRLAPFFVNYGINWHAGLLSDVWRNTKLRVALRWELVAKFLRVSAPAAVMIIIEVWTFEALTVLAASVGEVELGSHSVVANLMILAYMIPASLGQAASSRVGNFLGAGNAPGAKQAARVSMSMIVVSQSLIGACVFLFRHQLAKAYIGSDQPDVRAYAATLFALASWWMVFDGIQGVGCSVLRGIGRPNIGALVNVIGYICVGVPLAASLTKATSLKFRGAYVGIGCGVFAVCVSVIFFLLRADWDLEARRAADLVGKEHTGSAVPMVTLGEGDSGAALLLGGSVDDDEDSGVHDVSIGGGGDNDGHLGVGSGEAGGGTSVDDDDTRLEIVDVDESAERAANRTPSSER